MRSLHLLSSLSCFLSLSLFLAQPAHASILAIDLGGEWTKASLIKPGVPFDVLLNRDSKRKIQSSVAWKNGDRLFGSDAFNLATRFPTDSFSHIKSLQGVSYDSDAVSYFKQISSVETVATSRNTVAFRRPNGTEWTVEELIGMQLAYIKELAESVGDEKVQDVVVAVPPYFSQFERDALADAVEIANLRLLVFVHDGTSVAVNYAMTRTFPKPEYHVIYDAGASSIRATVVQFSTAPGDSKSKSTTKDSTQITVAGVGFDKSIGGTELNRRLRDLLVEDFNQKYKSKKKLDVRQDARGMAKLWKEAGRVKAILSTNTESMITVESVAFDIDYRSKITRAKFEESCEDMKSKFAQPVLDAIANAGLTLDDINSVILTGGHSRTPMVQAAVKAVVGEAKMSSSVNADESAVLGAALYGATLSRQFRTKDIKVQDITVHDLQVTYTTEPKSADSVPKTINTVIFPAGSKTGAKKTLTFKRRNDFIVKMSYKKSPGSGIPTEVLEAEITGVNDAITNLTERGAIDPVVKATVVLSESGFATIQDTVAYGEIKDSSLTGKLKSIFAGKTSSTQNEDAEPTALSAEPAEETLQAPFIINPHASASASTTSSEASTTPSPEKTSPNTISLGLDLKPLSIPALTATEKKEARERLRAVDHMEAAKRRREDARNGLESYVYRLRDLLEGETDSPFQRCSTEEERKKMAETLEQTITWMHLDADEDDLIQLWDKRDVLSQMEKPIQHRYREIEAFPDALNNSQKWNFVTQVFLLEARQNLTKEEEAGLPSKWTKSELDALEKTLKDHEAWLDEWVEKQKSVKQNEDPVILTAEMRARAKTLETQLQKLVKRKYPKKKPAKSTTSTTTATTSPTPNSSGETTTTEVPPVVTEPVQEPGQHEEL